MTPVQEGLKRGFDFLLALAGLLLLWPIIVVASFLAARDTGASGFFVQSRVGRHGKLFKLVKIRTMRDVPGTFVTTKGDSRITPLGAWLRRWKIDELPQLFNVLVGDMSFVGPRPDMPEMIDLLKGEDREILELRPGITGPATLKYRNEEELLAAVDDPVRYNSTVVWPDKVRINRHYLQNWSFAGDIHCILATLRGN